MEVKEFLHYLIVYYLFKNGSTLWRPFSQFVICRLSVRVSLVKYVLTRGVILKLLWFEAHCKTYKPFLAHFGYKIKNIF
jgi:hypothetical protein